MPNENPRPLVDDKFWFEFSRTQVQQAIQRHDEAAGRFQTLAIWAWGIYTSLQAVGFTLANKQLSTEVTAIIALPSLLLIATYWCAIWVQTPTLRKYDPRIPSQIQRAYVASVTEKMVRLRWTKFVSALAATSVSIAIVSASYSPTKNIGRFESKIIRADGFQFVTLTGYSENQSPVTVSIRATPNSTNLLSSTLIPTKDGLIQASLPIGTPLSNLWMVLEWDRRLNERIRVSTTLNDIQ